MDFSILLPKTKQLENGWGVILRDLTMTNQFVNVEIEDYFIKYVKYENTYNLEGEEAVGVPVAGSQVEYGPFSMKSGIYTSRNQFLAEVNRVLKQCKAPFKTTSSIWEYDKVKVMKTNFGMELDADGKIRYGRYLYLSYKLAVALGFKQPSSNIEEHIPYALELSSLTEKGLMSNYPENINYFYPKQIVINCDLLSNSIIGSRQSKVLHIINTTEIQGDMINFNMKSTIFRDLDVLSFSKIRFWITNLKGEKLEALSTMPTSLSLTFIKS